MAKREYDFGKLPTLKEQAKGVLDMAIKQISGFKNPPEIVDAIMRDKKLYDQVLNGIRCGRPQLTAKIVILENFHQMREGSIPVQGYVHHAMKKARLIIRELKRDENDGNQPKLELTFLEGMCIELFRRLTLPPGRELNVNDHRRMLQVSTFMDAVLRMIWDSNNRYGIPNLEDDTDDWQG